MNKIFLCILLMLLAWAPAADTLSATGSETDIEIGIGYDDNPFLTPDEGYFDQFALTTIIPDRQSGVYIPARIKGSFTGNGDDRRLLMTYRLRHHAYSDSETGNADETNARISAGIEWVTGRDQRRENTFFVTPYAGYNKEVYFDRDTGADQVFTQGNASDRFSYVATGLKSGYRHRTGENIEYEIKGLLEARDYEELAGVRSLDSNRLRLSAGMETDMTDVLKLYADYYYQIRNYDHRLSRNVDGELLTGNSTLKYQYHDVGLSLRYRPESVWRLFLDLDYRIRNDDFSGYNDYTETGYRIRSVWREGGRRLRAAVRLRNREYDNAFIFDMPTNPAGGLANPQKDYDILDIDIKGQIPLWGRASLFGEVDYRDQETTDPRYTYDRLQFIAGLVWEF